MLVHVGFLVLVSLVLPSAAPLTSAVADDGARTDCETIAGAFLDRVAEGDWDGAAELVTVDDLARLRAESERLRRTGAELQVRGAGSWQPDPSEDIGPMPLLTSLLGLGPSLPSPPGTPLEHRVLVTTEASDRSFTIVETWTAERSEPQPRVLPLRRDDGRCRVSIEYALTLSAMRHEYLQGFLIEE